MLESVGLRNLFSLPLFAHAPRFMCRMPACVHACMPACVHACMRASPLAGWHLPGWRPFNDSESEYETDSDQSDYEGSGGSDSNDDDDGVGGDGNGGGGISTRGERGGVASKLRSVFEERWEPEDANSLPGSTQGDGACGVGDGGGGGGVGCVWVQRGSSRAEDFQP
jgi:hypothetical protein